MQNLVCSFLKWLHFMGTGDDITYLYFSHFELLLNISIVYSCFAMAYVSRTNKKDVCLFTETKGFNVWPQDLNEDEVMAVVSYYESELFVKQQ